MGQGKEITISLNTGFLLGNYLAEIQNLLDIVSFICAGHGSVTDESYDAPMGFINVHPASNLRLSFQQAKEKSHQWLLTSFLTESVNITGGFLDETRRVCALCRLCAKKKTTGKELNAVLGDEARKFHRLGFPDKFEALRSDFGVTTNLQDHFLSLNQARNCLVHRKGIVAGKDTNEGDKLVIKWRIMQVVAKPADGTPEITLVEPKVLEAESEVYVRVVDRTKAIDVGQEILLAREELCQNIFTLFLLAQDLVKSAEFYMKTIGLLQA